MPASFENLHKPLYENWLRNRPDNIPNNTLSVVPVGDTGGVYGPMVWSEIDQSWVVDAPTSNVLIEDLIFYSVPGEFALIVKNQANSGVTVTVRNCIFFGAAAPALHGGAILAVHPAVTLPAGGKGIKINSSHNVTVEDTFFENITEVAIEVSASNTRMNNIKLLNNRFLNAQAMDVRNFNPGITAFDFRWESKMIQWRNLFGKGNECSGNRAVNMPGKSFTTDWINIYECSGVREIDSGTGQMTTFPLLISNNKIVGPGEVISTPDGNKGAYNTYSAGIQICDHAYGVSGGQYVNCVNNVVVFPGRAGINVNGGTDHTISQNTVVMSETVYGYDPSCDFNVFLPDGFTPNPRYGLDCDGHLSPAAPAPTTVYSVNNYTNDGNPITGVVFSDNKWDCDSCYASVVLEPGSATETGTFHDITLTDSLTALLQPSTFFGSYTPPSIVYNPFIPAFRPQTAGDPFPQFPELDRTKKKRTNVGNV